MSLWEGWSVREATAHADWFGFSACTTSSVPTASITVGACGRTKMRLRIRQRAMSWSAIKTQSIVGRRSGLPDIPRSAIARNSSPTQAATTTPRSWPQKATFVGAFR
jgi:hypothetical protein